MLSCAGAKLDADDQDRNSLAADDITVSGDAYFDDGFCAVGTVSLRSASIGGSLLVMPTELAADPGAAVALDATGAQIGYELRWEPDRPGGYWRPNADNPFGWFFVYADWAGTALGWTLFTLIVAGYTGLARRVDNP